MCFSIPYKVLKSTKDQAILEGGKVIKLGNELNVRKDEYLQILGNVAVGKLSKAEGLKIRKLIKKLNTYESAN